MQQCLQSKGFKIICSFLLVVLVSAAVSLCTWLFVFRQPDTSASPSTAGCLSCEKFTNLSSTVDLLRKEIQPLSQVLPTDRAFEHNNLFFPSPKACQLDTASSVKEG
eukprot:sb/3477654/